MIGRPNRLRRDKTYPFRRGVVAEGTGTTAPMRKVAEAFGWPAGSRADPRSDVERTMRSALGSDLPDLMEVKHTAG